MFAEGAKALLFLTWNKVQKVLLARASGKRIFIFAFLALSFLNPLFAYADFVSISPLQDTSRWGSCTADVIQRIEREPSIRFYNPFSSNPNGTVDYRCHKDNPDQVWYRACGGAANQCSVTLSSDGFRNFSSGGLIDAGRDYQYDTVTGRLITGNATFVIAEACTGEFRNSGDEIIRACRAPGGSNQTWTEHCDRNDENRCYITQGAGGVDTIRSAPYDRRDATATYTIENNEGRVTRAYVTQGGQAQEGSLSNGIEEAVGVATGWIEDITIGLVSAIIWFVFQIILWILLGLLAIVSWLFDGIINEFVIGMGKYVTSPDAVEVKLAWVMIRDLANIGIIGGLVATAIGTIVGSGNYSVSKTLARLILAALLVNFSYFFAGAVIDFSNFTAKAAYENLVTPEDCGPSTGACGPAAQLLLTLNLSQFGVTVGSAVTDGNGSVQNSIDGSGAQTTISASGAERSNEGISLSRQATFTVLQVIFVVVLMFVMLSAISLLIARFVALIFILITSPIGIAGSAVPLLKSYSDEWWKELWAQTMFAPVYFVLLGISLKLITSFAEPIKGGVWAQEAAGGNMSSTIGLIAMFTIAIGFSWTALSTAKKMSQASGRFKELYDGVQKYMTGPALGGLRMIGVETLGRGGEFALDRYNRFLASDLKGKGVRGFLAKGAQGLLKRSPLGRAGELALKGVATSKFGGKKIESYEELRKRRSAREGELSGIGEREKALAKIDNKENMEELERLHRAALQAGDPEKTPEAKEAWDNYNKFKSEVGGGVIDITPEALHKMRDRREWKRLNKLMPFLSDAQFKQFAHDKDIPKNIRNKFHEMRMKPLKDLMELAKGRIIDVDKNGDPIFDKNGHMHYRDINDADVKKQREVAGTELKKKVAAGQLENELGRVPTEKEVAERAEKIAVTDAEIDKALGGYNLGKYIQNGAGKTVANKKTGAWDPPPEADRAKVTADVEATRGAVTARVKTDLEPNLRKGVEANTRASIEARERQQIEEKIEDVTAEVTAQLATTLGRTPYDREVKRGIEDRLKRAVDQQLGEAATKQAIDDETQKRVDEEVARAMDEEVNKRIRDSREPYSYVQGQLYTLFKYGGVSKGDMVTFAKHDPSLLENRTLLDGGLTHGSKMAIYESGELTYAQRELAKNTWQSSVREANAAAARVIKATDVPYPDRANTEDGRREMAAEFETNEFKSAVATVKRFGDGKQPHEFAGQIHDNDLLAPATALAVSPDVLLEIPKTHDPVYWKGMIKNLVSMVKAGYGANDPAEQARLRDVFEWFRTSGAGSSGMQAALGEALAEQFDNDKQAGQAEIEERLGGKIRWT